MSFKKFIERLSLKLSEQDVKFRQMQNDKDELTIFTVTHSRVMRAVFAPWVERKPENSETLKFTYLNVDGDLILTTDLPHVTRNGKCVKGSADLLHVGYQSPAEKGYAGFHMRRNTQVHAVDNNGNIKERRLVQSDVKRCGSTFLTKHLPKGDDLSKGHDVSKADHLSHSKSRFIYPKGHKEFISWIEDPLEKILPQLFGSHMPEMPKTSKISKYLQKGPQEVSFDGPQELKEVVGAGISLGA
jgi:hypothetical protein